MKNINFKYFLGILMKRRAFVKNTAISSVVSWAGLSNISGAQDFSGGSKITPVLSSPEALLYRPPTKVISCTELLRLRQPLAADAVFGYLQTHRPSALQSFDLASVSTIKSELAKLQKQIMKLEEAQSSLNKELYLSAGRLILSSGILISSLASVWFPPAAIAAHYFNIGSASFSAGTSYYTAFTNSGGNGASFAQLAQIPGEEWLEGVSKPSDVQFAQSIAFVGSYGEAKANLIAFKLGTDLDTVFDIPALDAADQKIMRGLGRFLTLGVAVTGIYAECRLIYKGLGNKERLAKNLIELRSRIAKLEEFLANVKLSNDLLSLVTSVSATAYREVLNSIALSAASTDPSCYTNPKFLTDLTSPQTRLILP